MTALSTAPSGRNRLTRPMLALTAAAMLLTTACTDMQMDDGRTKTREGAAGGAVLGAIAGAMLSRDKGKGAVVGAAVGAIVGSHTGIHICG